MLATLFVALEWNSSDSSWAFFDDDDDLEAEMELEPLKRNPDEIPMMIPQEEKVEKQESEQLRVVDEDVELHLESSCVVVWNLPHIHLQKKFTPIII